MSVFAILAMDEKGGIGKDSTLPWPHNSDDLKWFKEKTIGKTVIMGSNTWNDPIMPKPLIGRNTVVMTSKPYSLESGWDHTMAGSPIDVLADLVVGGYDDIAIIGGANILNQFIDLCDEIYITNIVGEYNCDTFIDVNKLKDFPNTENIKRDSISITVYKK